jgi:hypothetical protein
MAKTGHQLSDLGPQFSDEVRRALAEKISVDTADQVRRGTLRVVTGMELGRRMGGIISPHPGQRRHCDAIAQVQIAETDLREQGLGNVAGHVSGGIGFCVSILDG